MPYSTEWESNPLALKHKGVKVYHVYKDDDADNPTMTYWFAMGEDDLESDAFDVRDLKAWREAPGDRNEYAHIERALRHAIETGEIDQEGVNKAVP